MISREYESLLDGITYADKFIWQGHYSFFMDAAGLAEKTKRFDRVLIPQCYGPPAERMTESFCKEAWRLVGKLASWDKLPLVFDNRNPQREAALVEHCFKGATKPVVLISTRGKSSPFPNKVSLLEAIWPLREKFDFVDLDEVTADKFFDLLALYERAAALIAIDNGLLHLAQATPSLPVIALVTHFPDLWHGTPRRRNHIAYIRYSEFGTRIREIPEALCGLGMAGNVASRFIHVWSDYERTDRRAIRRHTVAKQTWAAAYERGPWVRCVVDERALSRNATAVGEQKPVPFLKDLLLEAASRARPGDVIVFTNDDTCFAPSLTETIMETMLRYPAMWGARREHVNVIRPLTTEEMMKGYKHCGSDVFAFTLEWWQEHQDDIPDFLISFEAWDMVLKRLILRTGGVEVEDTCYHEMHLPYWHTPQNRECTGNLYNRELTRQWLAKHQIAWNDAFA